MADDTVRKLVGAQRQRMVASLLGHCEQADWYRKLSPVEQRELREAVLRLTATYHEFILDVLKVSKDDMVRSDQALALIQRVHDVLPRVEEALTSGR